MATRNPKNFEFKLGKQGLTLFVAGMSFLLFAVFIIGVMVGAHIDAYPEKIAQSIPAIIRRQFSHPPVANEKVMAVRDEEKVVPVSDDGIVTVLSPDAPVTSDALPAVAVGTAEKKVRPAALPEDTKSTARAPSVPAVAPEIPQTEAASKYSVQAGSFKSEKAALRFSAKIKPLGFQPRVEMVELPNKGNWFRVMVNGFASRAEAQQAVGVMAKNIKGVNGIVRPAN